MIPPPCCLFAIFSSLINTDIDKMVVRRSNTPELVKGQVHNILISIGVCERVFKYLKSSQVCIL